MSASPERTPHSERDVTGVAAFMRRHVDSNVVLLGAVCFTTALAYDTNIHGTFDLSKLTFLYAAAFLLLTGFMVRMISRTELHLARTPLDWPIAATVAALAVSTAMSADPQCSIFGAYKTFEGVLQILACLVLFFAASRLRRGQVVVVLGMIVLAAFGAGLYGLEQRLGNDPLAWTQTIDRRAIGTFGNPVFFGMFLAMAVPVAAGLALRSDSVEHSGRKRTFWWAGAVVVTGLATAWAYPAFQTFRGADSTSSVARVLLLVVVALTVCALLGGISRHRAGSARWSGGQSWLMVAMVATCNSALYASRTVGVLLALIVGTLFFVVFALLTDRSTFSRNRRTWLALALCFLIVNLGFNLWPETSTTARIHRLLFGTQVESADDAGSDPTSEFKPAGSLYKRLLLYKSGLNIIRAHPLFGIGPDAVERVISTYWSVDYQLAHDYLVEVEGFENRLHNEVLEVTATQGGLGLAARLWLYLAFLVMVWRGARVVAPDERVVLIGIAASLVVLAACNIFEYPTIPLSTTAWVLMGCAVAWIQGEGTEQDRPLVRRIITAPRGRALMWGGSLALLATLIWIWIAALQRPYVADSHYMKAKILERQKKLESALPHLEQAIALNPHLHMYRESLSNVLIAKIRALGDQRDEAARAEKERLARALIANSEEEVARSSWRGNAYAFLAAGQIMLSNALEESDSHAHATDVAALRRQGSDNLREAVSVNSFNSGLRYALARDHLRQGRWDEFIPLALQTMQYWPKNGKMPGVVLQAAGVLVNGRNIEDAERLLLAVKDAMPEGQRAKVWEGLARTYWAAQRWTDMDSAARTLQKIDPDEAEGARFRAVASLQTGRLDEAEAQARLFLHLKPGDQYGEMLVRSIAQKRASPPGRDQ